MKLIKKTKIRRMKKQASKTEIEYNEEIKKDIDAKMNKPNINIVETEHVYKNSTLTPEDKEFIISVAGEQAFLEYEAQQKANHE